MSSVVMYNQVSNIDYITFGGDNVKTIELTFEGFKTDRSHVPSRSGIYCVYTATRTGEKKVALHELIYIGEAMDCKDRLATHDRFEDWERELSEGQVLCYTFAAVPEVDRGRAEAALIFHHKPKLNDRCKDAFHNEDTEIIIAGKTNLLDTDFIVRKSK